MDMSKICDKVALELGWQLQDWITAGKATCNNGPHWMEKIKNKWHPVVYGDDFMEPDDLQSFLLSPQGRELMENHAEGMGMKFFAWDRGEYLISKLNYYVYRDIEAFCGYHKDKHVACLLAFCKLTGILTDQEVVE